MSTKYDDTSAKKEGWALFDCDGTLRILRLDCPADADETLPEDPIFKDDEAAVAFVKAKAELGSESHKAALALHEETNRWEDSNEEDQR